MRKLFNVSQPTPLMIIAFFAFLVVARLYHGHGLSDSSKILLTVTSFVFGFYINNLITQSRSRHAKIVEGLREEGGHIKAIYFMVHSVFNKEAEAELAVIDEYLMTCMDYKSVDYAKSAPAFRKLFEHTMKIEPKSGDAQQGMTYSHLVRLVDEISKARTRIEATVKERVSAFEWMTVAILLLLVIYFVFSLNSGGWVSAVITSFIATALLMLIIILNSLDSLEWKEDKWFWVPIEELFIGLDLLPYYPRILVDTGRLKLAEGKSVRLADYPHPYPDISDRKVNIHTEG